MRQGTIVTALPQVAALTLDDARQHLRITPDDTDQDDSILALVRAAERHVERELGMPIMRQTRATHLNCFPCGPIWLGTGADLNVESVAYISSAGVSTTLPDTNFYLDAVSRPAAIYPVTSWPSVTVRPSAVVVTWSAGYADTAAVPDDLRHALRLLIGHYDLNREAVVAGAMIELPLAVDALLRGFRVPMAF